MQKLLISSALAIPLVFGNIGLLAAQDSTDDTAPLIEAPTADAPTGEAISDLDAATENDQSESATADADAPLAGVDAEKIMREQSPDELRLKWITGATVTSPDAAVIGKISDLIMDQSNGQMTAAIVGVGGFLGIGEKKIAVPWEHLTIDYDANQVISDLTREQADQAPEYIFRDREAVPAPVDPVGAAPVAPAAPSL